MAALDNNYIAFLVKEIQGGNNAAFAEFFTVTCQNQYKFACGYLQDSVKAQAAIQDAYIDALKNIQALKEPALAVAWLNQINFRICYNMKGSRTADGLQGNSVTVGKNTYTVNQILNLPFSESQVLLLKYYLHQSTGVTAEMLDMSRSSVNRYMTNALRRLNTILN
jgi:DNA-directed RNA polymerase specialized sigma24 family protein